MGTLHEVNGVLTTGEELQQLVAMGRLDQAEAQHHPGALHALGAIASAAEDHASPGPSANTGVTDDDSVPFRPIGIGKPLSIEILTVYTGNAPSSWFGTPELLVVSGVRSIAGHGPASRAINQLIPNVKDKENYGASALREGSLLVYYSPAVSNSSTVCSIELVVDKFNEQAVERVASLIDTAAGLPVFAPAGLYLMAGSFLTRMAGSLGEAIGEDDAFMEASLELRFDTAGLPISFARRVVFVNDKDQDALKAYEPKVIGGGTTSERVALVSRESGEVYAGEAPYVIVNIDGARRPEYETFVPKLASASLLGQFYKSKNPSADVLEVLEESMELYNDFSFKKKADKLKADMSELSGEELERANKLYQAYLDNISNEAFKPADDE